MRRQLALVCLSATVAAGVLAGCGDDKPTRADSASTTEATGDPSALDPVEVSGEPGEAPTISFEPPFEIDETSVKVLTEGEGDPAEMGDTVTFNFVFTNGRDGKELESSFEGEPADVALEEGLLPPVLDALEGSKVGDRLLVGIAPDDGMGADESVGLEESDTVLFFAEIEGIRTPLKRAEGTEVDPVDGLPTVELADDGAPTITVPEDDPPTELVSQVLIEGDGAEVEAGQTITVHYTGVLWDSGETFDSSWEKGTPATFPIGTGGVIPGWDEGPVGQTVGSQVLLVVPPDKGYGEEGSGETIPPGATLVFVVDILDAV
jgi:peptidylprolyl isomerase